jgi:tRNA(Ile)-lysidine synthase
LKLPPLVAAVGRALRTAGTPSRGETLLVGLSGGPDSVALLDALALLRRPRGFRLVAAHLDHGLRPGSAADADFCRALCARLDVALRAGAADVRGRAARERGGLEQAARRERYAFLRRLAAAEQASAIAVAHTRDDQAETLLLRLLRGAGSTGLGGMRARRGRLLRPLLGVSRETVLAHLRERGLDWLEDPTNADLAHRRNRVRHELLPYLESRFNPRVREGLARAATLLADEAAHLRADAGALLRRIARREDDALVLRRAGLAQAPAALARATIREALRRAGGLSGVRAVHVERVRQLARRPPGAQRRLPLPGQREAALTRDDLRLGPRSAGAPKAVSSGRPK